MEAIATQTELFVYVIQAVFSHQYVEALTNSGAIVGWTSVLKAPGRVVQCRAVVVTQNQ